MKISRSTDTSSATAKTRKLRLSSRDHADSADQYTRFESLAKRLVQVHKDEAKQDRR